MTALPNANAGRDVSSERSWRRSARRPTIRGGHDEPDEVAGRRSGGCGPAAFGTGVEGEADGAEDDVQGLAGHAEAHAERGGDEQHGERLPGDRHRRPRHVDRQLGGGRREEGATDDEHGGPGGSDGARTEAEGEWAGRGT